MLAQSAPYEVSRAYELVSVPTSVLIDRDGRIVARVVGWDDQGLNGLIELECEAGIAPALPMTSC